MNARDFESMYKGWECDTSNPGMYIAYCRKAERTVTAIWDIDAANWRFFQGEKEFFPTGVHGKEKNCTTLGVIIARQPKLTSARL